MPSESELRALLRGEGEGGTRLDADRVIRLARARRRPKRLALGALGGLSALAVIVPVAAGIGAMGPMGASDSGGAALAPESMDAPADEEDAGSTLRARTECGAELAAGPSAVLGVGTVTAETTTVRLGTTVTIAADALDPSPATLRISLVLVRDGRVAGFAEAAGAGEVPVAAGAADVPLELELHACPVDGAADPARLAPGDYELVAEGGLASADGTVWRDAGGTIGELTVLPTTAE